MSGLGPSGFDIKTLDSILSDMESAELQKISPSLNVQPTALIGILNGIMAQAIFELWQLAGALYNGMDPDQAVSDQLASLALITGTIKEAATATQVIDCQVTLGAGFTAAPGTMFANVVNNSVALFTNKITAHNPGGSPSVFGIDFEAVNTGPIQCLAGTLTEIATPLAGWSSITNPSDGVVGSDIESDALLRVRRQQELAAAGSTTAAAIRSDVLQQMQPPTTSTPTTSCVVLYNDTEATDANNVPAHEIEVIARQVGATSNDDLALATLILNNKAAGIGTNGSTAKNVTDSQGNVQSVQFTRPSDVPIYVLITVVADPNANPPVSSAAVKAALTKFANSSWQPGDDVIKQRLEAAAFDALGVTDVTAFTLGIAPGPAGVVNIPISIRQTATLSSSNIGVTIT